MQDRTRFANMGGKLILALISLVVLMILIWLSGFAFIEVSVNGTDSNTAINYTMQNEKNEYTGTVPSKTLKKLTRKGSYQVLVDQGSNNAFALVNTGGFFGTTKINLQLQSEKERTFVGDNPQACMSFSNILISYSCNASIESLRIHTQADSTQPSAIKKIGTDAAFGNSILGDITIQDTLFLFTILELDDGTWYNLVPAPINNSDIRFEQIIKLPDILTENGEGIRYSITPFKEGFLVYDIELKKGYYFDALTDDAPEIITLPSTKEPEFNAYSLDVFEESILTVSMSGVAGREPNASYKPSLSLQKSKEKSDEVLSGNDEQKGTSRIAISTSPDKELKLNYLPDQVRFCSPRHVCILKSSNLEIYTINGGTFSRTASINNITQIESANNHFIAATPKGLLQFDAESLKGSYQYYFGDYGYCGMEIVGQQMLVCIENNHNTTRSKSVITISQTDKTDDIDKLVYELSKESFIKSIAAYGSFIHVAPDYGTLEYQPATDSIGYNQSKITETNNDVLKKVQSLGLDLNQYSVITSIK